MSEPQTRSSLYLGLSGAVLEPDRYQLSSGFLFTRTFAHFMAPFMMAFKPAPPGKPHPAPWRAVEGGFGFDIHVQVQAPASPSAPLQPTSALWLLVALLRLRVGPSFVAPVISSLPFQDAVTTEAIHLRPHEVEHTILGIDPDPRSNITEPDLQWLDESWANAERLLDISPEFSLLLQALDQSMFARHAQLAIVWVWSAMEALFSPGPGELRYRASSIIASYLEPGGLGRMALQKEVAKLYDSRSSAAHGRSDQAAESLPKTYAIGRRCALKIVSEGHVPTKAQLEARLFGADTHEPGA